MPCYKPVKSTMPESTANFPNATTAPGSCTVWGGPTGKPVVQPKYIPAHRARNR